MLLVVLTSIKGSKGKALTEGTGIVLPFVNCLAQRQIIHLEIK